MLPLDDQQCMKKIDDMHVAERPRERLLAIGPRALTDIELLATIIGSGTRGRNVFSLANAALSILDRCSPEESPQELLRLPGLGKAKSAALAAALEFSRRRINPSGTRIRSSADVYPLVRYLSSRKQEHFLTISLNGANEVIAVRTVTIGLVNATQVHPREVFCDAITDRACGIIVAHNHPSGELQPSAEDIKVTDVLRQAGKILGIKLLDHLIFSERGYYSFRERLPAHIGD